MQKLDLTGMQIGSWDVKEYVGNKKWLCQCRQCGTLKEVATYSLTSGKSTSCGKCGSKLDYDLTNKVFGQLRAVYYTGEDNKWLCECTCGRLANKSSKNLRYRRTTQCGNMHNKPLSEKDIEAIRAFKQAHPDIQLLSALKSKEEAAQTTGEQTTGEQTTGESIVKMRPVSSTQNLTYHTGLEKVEMIGKWFNDYRVIDKVDKDRYLCECVCGYRKEIRGYTLRHMPRQDYYKCRHVKIIDRQFDKLKVISREGPICTCKCECGNIVKVSIGNLLNGTTHSCGCMRHPKYSKDDFIRIIQEYEAVHKSKPQPMELLKLMDLKMTAIYENIHNYELEDYLDTKSNVMEKEIAELCGDGYIRNDRTVLDNLELDIYIPDKKLAFEINGAYWHSIIYKDELYHQHKSLMCAAKGIHLVHIFDFEWKDPILKNKLVSYINNLIHGPQKIYYARNLEVREISNAESLKFCNENHIQNGINSKISIGLFDNNELLSVMTFGAPRYNCEHEYELLRYCCKLGTGITGGAEKLFKFFTKAYNPKSIMTYSDITKFTGNVYTKLGFKPMKEPISTPGYVWVKGSEVLKRYQTQKHKLIESGYGDMGDTEDEIMINRGYVKVYNSGNLRLEWKQEQ